MCRGDLVGAADGRSLERFTRTFSFVHDVLASIHAMVGRWHLAEGVGSIAAQAAPQATAEHPRGDCRRHVLPSEKGGQHVGKTKRGKGTKIMVLSEAHGLPLAVNIASASPHEVNLIEPLLEKRVLRRRLHKLLYDQAADSDPLRKRLWNRGIELICPHRYNRVKPALQDGRSLRRYSRRWKIERSISWLQAFRRLVTRYEVHAHLFLGFVQLACMVIVLRRF